MKNIMKLAFLMIAVLGMTSCDLLNVNVDADVEGALDVYVDETMAKSAADWYKFSASNEIDPTEAKEYSDKIKGISVNEVVVRVDAVNPTSGVTLKKGTEFYITDGVETVSWPVEEDWFITAQVELTFGDVQGEYMDAAAMIKKAVENDGILTIGTSGDCDKSGVDFHLWMIIKTDVEASLL